MAFKTRLYWYALLGIIIFLGLIPFLAQQFWIVVLSLVFVYIACSEMWSFLAGHAGLLVLGQQAFLGLGVYTQLIVSEILKWPPWVGVILSPFAGASAAALVSLSVKRLRGFFFAFSTLLISEILYNAFINWPLVGGAWGKRMEVARFVPSIVIYYFSAFIAIIACIIVYYIHNSKLGVGVRAVGCDEEAAAELGVNVFRCKAICLILAGAITALAGSSYAFQLLFITVAASFSFEFGISLVFISVIGGVGTIIGPIIGSLIYVILRSVVLSAHVGLSLILFGLACIIIIFVAPYGVWGTISRKFKLKPYI